MKEFEAWAKYIDLTDEVPGALSAAFREVFEAGFSAGLSEGWDQCFEWSTDMYAMPVVYYNPYNKEGNQQ